MDIHDNLHNVFGLHKSFILLLRFSLWSRHNGHSFEFFAQTINCNNKCSEWVKLLGWFAAWNPLLFSVTEHWFFFFFFFFSFFSFTLVCFAGGDVLLVVMFCWWWCFAGAVHRMHMMERWMQYSGAPQVDSLLQGVLTAKSNCGSLWVVRLTYTWPLLQCWLTPGRCHCTCEVCVLVKSECL